MAAACLIGDGSVLIPIEDHEDMYIRYLCFRVVSPSRREEFSLWLHLNLPIPVAPSCRWLPRVFAWNCSQIGSGPSACLKKNPCPPPRAVWPTCPPPLNVAPKSFWIHRARANDIRYPQLIYWPSLQGFFWYKKKGGHGFFGTLRNQLNLVNGPTRGLKVGTTLRKHKSLASPDPCGNLPTHLMTAHKLRVQTGLGKQRPCWESRNQQAMLRRLGHLVWVVNGCWWNFREIPEQG